MAAQHKRAGRKAKLERKVRIVQRQQKVVVRYPRRKERLDGISPGRLVILAEVV